MVEMVVTMTLDSLPASKLSMNTLKKVVEEIYLNLVPAHLLQATSKERNMQTYRRNKQLETS
jgi:hypothetical protein